MKFVKLILTLAAVVVAVSVQQTQAQVLQSANGDAWVNIAASATSNMTATTTFVIDCSASRQVAVKWTGALGGAGTEVSGIVFAPSVDGTLPTTVPVGIGYHMARASAGTTPVTVQTNFDTLGYRYLIGAWVTNGTAQILSNKIEYVVIKNTGK